ncbi:MAG: FAD-dependent oxidoreductase [Acidobacteriota bacterium]
MAKTAGEAPGKVVQVLLVGGGHAHLEVVRRFMLASPPWMQLTLVSAYPSHHYSGMVPGFLTGVYSEEEIRFDLAALAARAGARFILGRATSLDPAACAVTLEDGQTLTYDLVSFGIGSTPAGGDTPEVSRHATVVKPMSRAVALRHRLAALAGMASSSVAAHVVVVGGGAAGVEIACAAATVLDDAQARREITIIEGSDAVLRHYSARFRSRAEAVLAARSIDIRRRTRVVAVHPDHVVLDDARTLPADLTVWMTGARGVPFLASSSLSVDAGGFLLVDDALRSIDDVRVMAAGDCATPIHHPETPKAGVYAVRHGPVLWDSLLAASTGAAMPRYRPQPGFLSILNTGVGQALLRYRKLISHSRWAWRLKDGIDRRFMRRYHSLIPG